MKTTASSRLELLRAARVVQQAAVDGDVDGLHSDLCRLRNALVAHVRHDGRGADGEPDTVARLARHGHRHLLRLVDELLAASATAGSEDCACLLRSAELRALLVRQARLEHRVRPS